ncbi:MAG: hypothetical protein WC975_04045 [Phycisphaerae bacterium]
MKKNEKYKTRLWALDSGLWPKDRSGLWTKAKSLKPKALSFSLAELMIAIGILGIGMMIIAGAFPVALDQSRQAMELSTSQMVLNEAVNNLKTQVQWTELERYIDNSTTGGASYPQYQLSPSGTTNPICLLSFDQVDSDLSGPLDYFSTAADNHTCIYSGDNTSTYGWVAAVQKIGNQCYKFWIFVVREPTGLINSSNKYIFNLHKYQDNLTSTSPPPSKASLTINTGNNDDAPQRGMQLLADDGNLYTVKDVVLNSGTTYNLMLDRQITGPLYVAYVKGAKTRKNPVIAVFQTVIVY